MATTKETMNVIANGVDTKDEPEIIMGGKVIAVEVPDELAEVFEGIIGSLIKKSESAEAESPENNDSNGGDWDDDEETRKQQARRWEMEQERQKQKLMAELESIKGFERSTGRT